MQGYSDVNKLKKYVSFFRLRFVMGLQYRTAAFAGIATQFAWGFMEITVFHAFNNTDPAAFPMGFGQLASYVWMQQAFLALFMTWFMENEIFDSIMDGNICYELCRPIDIYDMWFARSVANRSLSFFTVSPQGLRLIFSMTAEILQGIVIPIPFFPPRVRQILELLPFASMENAPLRIYSGHISGGEAAKAMLLQIFWILVLIAIGKLICRRAMKKVTVQGG